MTWTSPHARNDAQYVIDVDASDDDDADSEDSDMDTSVERQ